MKSCDDKVDSCVYVQLIAHLLLFHSLTPSRHDGLEYYMIFTLSIFRTQLAGNFQITFPDIKVNVPLLLMKLMVMILLELHSSISLSFLLSLTRRY